MEKSAIFIDGGYLQKVTRGMNNLIVDYPKLSKKLALDSHILRTYYYYCMPYKSKLASSDEIKRYENAQRFVERIEAFDKHCFRKGKLEYRGTNTDGKPIYVQKRVDILLACDLVLLSTKSKITQAILITGDSDFIPAIEVAKQEGIEIKLAYSPLPKCIPHENLIKIADERVLMDGDFFNDVKYK